ncbi:hypothetical protein BKA67DRAFT_325087 [Truncatella angustata]|uniref:Secreted protein n=1 Tax=Truncatella angustata TaxID=152316 RepID=A0A9P8ZX40_9PEZI|nr:uncharacterized protein BKA67DRAFT_325087 [Truncatella angustata]KAH6653582.1 hypothetical protein BKA67DRAFT_325087 [Truncatella angustata]
MGFVLVQTLLLVRFRFRLSTRASCSASPAMAQLSAPIPKVVGSIVCSCPSWLRVCLSITVPACACMTRPLAPQLFVKIQPATLIVLHGVLILFSTRKSVTMSTHPRTDNTRRRPDEGGGEATTATTLHFSTAPRRRSDKAATTATMRARTRQGDANGPGRDGDDNDARMKMIDPDDKKPPSTEPLSDRARAVIVFNR